MAEGFLRSFDSTLEIYSAGTHPEVQINPRTVQVMKEVGIDLTNAYPKNVIQFIDKPFDYVITVCGGAKDVCPIFTGKVKHRLHIGFEDPVKAKGTEEEILFVYRRIRDEIKERFYQFYIEERN